MLEKLNQIEATFDEINRQLADPQIIADQESLKELAKRRSDIEDLAMKIKEYKACLAEIEDAKELIKEATDHEMDDYLKKELAEQKAKQELLEEDLKVMLITKDPNDDKDIIIEIRAGAGGDEASLFATELFRMYSRYAENRKWKVEVLSSSLSGLGGYKEIAMEVKGKGAYSRLKYESGVHRIQRIPVTESGGRIHTSTATVAVLPEAEDVEVDLDPNDLRIDIFRAGGPGGQSVNTADSAVRVIHIPSGIMVQCQDERSQLQNRERALTILRARLLKQRQEEADAELAETRRLQIGTGDRSERIRTYNFPQNRVTDHRVGLTLHRLEAILGGDLDEIIETLVAADKAMQLKEVG